MAILKKLYRQSVKKSVLTDGVTLKIDVVNQIEAHLGCHLEKGEKIDNVKIIVNDKVYTCTFIFVNNEKRDNCYQFRYNSRSNLAKTLRSLFPTQARDVELYNKVSESNFAYIDICLNETAGVFEFSKVEPTHHYTTDFKSTKDAYERYLATLEGKFAGYINAIDKSFVKEKTVNLFGVPTAYGLTSSEDVLFLVEEIRRDPETNKKDKESSSRCPSCSLKKYAEYLTMLEKTSKEVPFDINQIIETISATGLIFDSKFVQRFLCSLLTKPFVILSGLTGSGKTQLAMTFPKLICKDETQYKLIPVGADWTNREHLLGYPNALRPGEYVMPDNKVLQLILEASKEENQDKPYFLVLDEMNMSYVERYFADFLSVMESGEPIPLWTGNKEVPEKITLPKNLFIVGTINVDETTYMFSPKVLDRANVIEFRINKEQMIKFLDGIGSIKPVEDLSEQAANFVSIANQEFTGMLDAEMKKTLIDMFENLGKIQKEFGYRTAHEMSRFISIAKKYTDMTDNDAIDCAIVQKLLPKVHGSRKKISPVLKALWALCYNNEAVELDTLEVFPAVDAFKYPLTAEKIWRMFLIAQDNGFTSFAEA